MNLFQVFAELDEAYGYSNNQERQTLINNLIGAGKKYNFDKYPTEQLYRMWNRIKSTPKKVQTDQPKAQEVKVATSIERDWDKYCDCGTRLSDAGFCPVCDDGYEDQKD